jgi:hypothetical protein
MLECPLQGTSLYTTLVLALRDMRDAHGRDAVTGRGNGDQRWIGLVLGMIVLDTLSGKDGKVGERWSRLLTAHGISPQDANLIYKVRCSLLHGYGPPSRVDGRRIFLTREQDAFAIESDSHDRGLLSVPVFCRVLVERIAFEAHASWDASLVDTEFKLG